jgi:hypothetical protein
VHPAGLRNRQRMHTDDTSTRSTNGRYRTGLCAEGRRPAELLERGRGGARRRRRHPSRRVSVITTGNGQWWRQQRDVGRALQKRRCSMNREPIPDRFCAQQAGTTPSYRRRLGRFPIAASSAVKSTARTTASNPVRSAAGRAAASCSATNSGNGPDRSASASVTRCPDIGDFCHNRQGVEWWGCALCAARAAPCSHYVLNGECDDAPVCAI